MPREVNHGGHASLEEAVGAGGDAQTPSPAVPSASRLRRGVTARWFAAIGSHGAPRVEAPPSGPRKRVVAAPLAIGALVVLAAALAALDHVGMTGGIVPPLLLLLAALGVVLWKMGGAQGSPQPPLVADRSLVSESPSRGLELDGERLAFRLFAARLDSAETLLRLDAPFGVTLLASPRRDRLLVLFSSASGTFYLGAGFDAAARRAFAPLLDCSFTVVGDDAGMDAVGPDGEPLALAPEELASLLDALVEQSPTCLERFVLTDARGASLTLDGRHLCIGDRTVDSNAPLEWKPIVFQEAFGQAIAVYQGTWIRQSSTELTLVALLPALGPSLGAELDLSTLDCGVLRDLRLMQASPEPPPPTEQRVAIDRLFMLQVRSALDRAPRASRQPERAQA